MKIAVAMHNMTIHWCVKPDPCFVSASVKKTRVPHLVTMPDLAHFRSPSTSARVPQYVNHATYNTKICHSFTLCRLARSRLRFNVRTRTVPFIGQPGIREAIFPFSHALTPTFRSQIDAIIASGTRFPRSQGNVHGFICSTISLIMQRDESIFQDESNSTF
jgi:hypothetical protein